MLFGDEISARICVCVQQEKKVNKKDLFSRSGNCFFFVLKIGNEVSVRIRVRSYVHGSQKCKYDR